ncbi:putative Late nodulin [Medicago truncatula]|uniref:Nodule Cysteine-Rich (NCR) secreted peptide n=1 Tax=Medicago truncatula TaxID=3880 RepID=G7JBD8_MEDTR|nr:Nodule Cysteine-Rich (NCR) secreted peptide [Medicago truncatula]AFK45041.1 unknown [Medicago truncatula]RHN69206.1 putative Late nodulin [Medicago truncatula]
MARTLQFVYVMILFFSLFLVAKGDDVKIKCVSAIDCMDLFNLLPIVYKCINNICVYEQSSQRLI